MRQDIDEVKNDYHIRQFGTRLQVNYQFNENHSIGARYSYMYKTRSLPNTRIDVVYRTGETLIALFAAIQEGHFIRSR